MQAVERVLDEVDRACALPPRDGDGIAALESTLQAVAAAPAAGREVATPRKVATPREVATPVSCMGRAALRAALMESLGGPAADARRMEDTESEEDEAFACAPLAAALLGSDLPSCDRAPPGRGGGGGCALGGCPHPSAHPRRI